MLLGITAITAVLTVTTVSVRLWAARNPADQLLYLSQAQASGGDLSTLYVHDLRTDAQHALVKDFLGWGVDAAWSPEGDRIAFSMFEDSVVERNIHILDVVSGEVERITGDGSTTDHNSPSWSPDGTQLAYHALDPATASLDIYSHDLEADRQRVVYAAATSDLSPVWSPAGDRLLFVSQANSLWSSDIVLLDLETGASRRLTDRATGELGPAWSPTGDRYVFASSQGYGERYKLYIGEIDEEINTPLLVVAAQGGLQAEPAWSTNGRLIAYTHFTRDGNQIYVVSPDGGEPIAITPPGEAYRQPHWRP